jgi:hypothetical protein
MKLIQLLENQLSIDLLFDNIKVENGKILLNQLPHNIYNFNCHKLKSLTSLENCPEEINGCFDCTSTNITSLEFAPKIVHKDFICVGTKITSLDGAPLKCDKFICSHNNILHLKGIGRSYLKECNTLILPDTLKSNILGLCRVKKLEYILISQKLQNNESHKAFEIVKKYLNTDGSECQEELIQNGFNDYAKF